MNEWISVKDKYPSEGTYVLVWDGNLDIDDFPYYNVAAYRTFSNGSFFVCGSYTLHDVTHWIPLPSPPEDI